MIDRRTFLAGTGAILLAAPLVAEAQQIKKVYRIGWMIGSSIPASAHLIDSFKEGMRELGWLEGKNIEYEIRTADGNPERFPAFAAELVRLKVDLILAPTAGAARAAKDATNTIPIVFVVTSRPAESGLVASLARPGGNITGLSLMDTDVLTKQLQILKEAVPNASRVSVLQSRVDLRPVLQELEAVAPSLGLQVQGITARSLDDFDVAFASMTRGHSNALLVTSDYLFFLHRRRLAELTAATRLPAMFSAAEYVKDGCLMSYAPSFLFHHRRAAVYVDKILKGAKPADLPVEQPTKFELIINLKTAKALGLTIPPSLLGRADEVIQ